MLLLHAENLEEYLRSAGHVPVGVPLEVSRLTGGVSNEVFYVSFPAGGQNDFVLKQAREQLRVAAPWFAPLNRIWREVEVLRICAELLTTNDAASGRAVVTPKILFEDRDNYLFAMTAAPRDHAVWKEQLLDGTADCEIAAACGQLLGRLHAGSWHDAGIARRLDDRELFDQLRLDPYFRYTARQQPEAAPSFMDLIDEIWNQRHCLVHADFSPKNLLVFDAGLMMVDYETGHYGDPAFDLGFFLAHLMLKAYYRAPDSEPFFALTRAFWDAYAAQVRPAAGPDAYDELVARGIRCLAGCAWARLDGKSTIEYLPDEQPRCAVRSWCRELFGSRPRCWDDVLEAARASMKANQLDV